MANLKITVDQLKNYLGTGLKIEHPSTKGHRWKLHHDEGVLNTISISSVLLIGAKPICYRLSDLDKEIEHNGERFVPVEKLFPIDTEFERSAGITSMDYMQYLLNDGFKSFHYELIQKLFEWHFWPFGEEYFEQGLVIDKRKEAANG